MGHRRKDESWMRLANACLRHWRNGVHGCRLGAATAQRWALRQRARQQTGSDRSGAHGAWSGAHVRQRDGPRPRRGRGGGLRRGNALGSSVSRGRSVGLLVSRGEPRRLADRWRGKREGQRPKVRVLQHAGYPRPHREPARRRDLADCAGGLLSANQVRGRARARGVGRAAVSTIRFCGRPRSTARAIQVGS